MPRVETAKRFFVSHGKPCSRSTFTLQKVEGFLNKLANLTKEDDQYQVLAYAYLLLLHFFHFFTRLCACDVRSFCSHGQVDHRQEHSR